MTDLSLWATEEARKIADKFERLRGDGWLNGAMTIQALRGEIAAAMTSALLKGQEERQEALFQSEQGRFKAEQFIERLGYRHCDIAACNCGAWHKG